jgi:hypothetical protein
MTSFRILNVARPPASALAAMTPAARYRVWVQRQFWACVVASIALYAVIATGRYGIEQAWISLQEEAAAEAGGAAAAAGSVEGLADTHLLHTLRRLCTSSETFARAFTGLGLSVCVLGFYVPFVHSLLWFGAVAGASTWVIMASVATNDARYLRVVYAVCLTVVSGSLMLGRRSASSSSPTAASNAGASGSARATANSAVVARLKQARRTASATASTTTSATTSTTTASSSIPAQPEFIDLPPTPRHWAPGLRWVVIGLAWVVWGEVFPALEWCPALLLEVFAPITIRQVCVSYFVVTLGRAVQEHLQSKYPAVPPSASAAATDNDSSAAAATNSKRKSK